MGEEGVQSALLVTRIYNNCVNCAICRDDDDFILYKQTIYIIYMLEFCRVENVSLALVHTVSPIPSPKVAAAVKRLMSLVNVFFPEWEHDEGLIIM